LESKAEILSDSLPIFHAQRIHGCLSSQSFWKSGAKISPLSPTRSHLLFIGKTVGGALSQVFSNESQKFWSVDKQVDKGVDRVGPQKSARFFVLAHDVVFALDALFKAHHD
jgi:hypothetical protein